MNSRTLTRKVFNAIRNEILTTDRHLADIGVDYNISASTVSTVNIAGTWENHLAHKRALKTLRQRGADERSKKSKVERAADANLHPVNPEERRQERELAEGLKKLEITPTREEFEALERRVDLVNRQISYIAGIPFIGHVIESQLKRASHDHHTEFAARKKREAQRTLTLGTTK